MIKDYKYIMHTLLQSSKFNDAQLLEDIVAHIIVIPSNINQNCKELGFMDTQRREIEFYRPDVINLLELLNKLSHILLALPLHQDTKKIKMYIDTFKQELTAQQENEDILPLNMTPAYLQAICFKFMSAMIKVFGLLDKVKDNSNDPYLTSLLNNYIQGTDKPEDYVLNYRDIRIELREIFSFLNILLDGNNLQRFIFNKSNPSVMNKMYNLVDLYKTYRKHISKFLYVSDMATIPSM